MRNSLFLYLLISFSLSATVVNYSELPTELQNRVVPDMEGRVLVSDDDTFLIEEVLMSRDLPTVIEGWPVSYIGSNCKNGAIYVNMDADPEAEILFGVGTKVTALNLDGTVVEGWPKQLSFYIWSSPAAGDIDGDGDLEIVCTSRNNTNANSGELYAFELNGTPCEGFPVVQAGGGTNNASLFDLDADGDMEILVNIRNHPQGWVYVFDGDGSVYPGFPQELDYIPGAGISAGDVTGDGIPEIIALSYNMLHVFDLTGTLLPGFPISNTGYTYSYSQPILFDLDDDGLNDIIWGGCSDEAGAVFAVNQNASSVTGWPQTTDYWIFGTVAIGDIDQDGAMDVVIGDQVSSGTPANHIFAWDAAGNNIEGFPAGPTNAIYAQIGIADLDGDNNVELMIDDNNFGFGYDCYNHDGTHCTDWPIACGTIWSSTTMQITPTFGDVDNDGDIEIIGAATDIVNWVVECYLWETGEAWNEDLAFMIVDGCNMQHNGLYSPTLLPPAFNPPQNLVSEVIDFNGVSLTWEEPEPSGSDVMEYSVYRDGILIQALYSNIFFYNDTALNAGEYEYYVTASYEDPVGESEPSNIEALTITLPAPTNLDGWTSGAHVMLIWDAPSTTRDLESYTMYRDGEVRAENITGPMYIEINLPTAYYSWEVQAIYDGGWESELSESFSIYHVGSNEGFPPLETELSLNYPNPFNPETSISFSVSESTVITELSIFNLKGQKIKTLINEQLPVGQHSVVWNGTDEFGKSVSSGVYLYKMKSGDYTKTRKMILMK
jgi:FG-GAP-like repeat/FlgD Ig-like domain/FG-GAP repeat